MDLESRIITLEYAVRKLSEALLNYGTLIEKTNENLIRLNDQPSKLKEEK